MNRKNLSWTRLFYSVASLLLVAIPLSGQQLPVDPLVQNCLEEIDKAAESIRESWKVPGMSVAIVKGDSVIFAKGYGVRELGRPETVDEFTQFTVASNSKAFTTTALAILVDEKKLKWDDPVSKYLPEFQMPDAFVTRELTVRDLVCHRSGFDTFSGDLLWYDTTYTADEILSRVRFLKPVSSFRSRYGYQNLMFIAAGKVVEKVSGMKWAQFVQERILDQIGLTHTSTSVAALKDNFALPHNESGGKGMRSLPPGNVDNCWGACGINSCAKDLANWMRLQLGRGTFEGKTIFSRKQSWELWSPQTIIPLSEQQAAASPTRHFSAYGLGFVLNDYQGRKIIGHSGGLDGMISHLAMIPEENLGLVVLTNSESPASRILRDVIFDQFLNVPDKRDWNAEALKSQADLLAAEQKFKEQADAARVANTSPTLALDKYPGTYSSEMYGDVTIEADNGNLVLRLVPAPNFVADLEHWQFNTFQIKWRDSVHYNFPRGFVNFTINGHGATEKLVIDQPNNDFWFYELDLIRTK